MTDHASPDASPHLRTWTSPRIVRLAFLVGRGCAAAEIGADAQVAATAAAVRRKAQRLGLTFRAADGPLLPDAVVHRLEAAAARRGLDRDGLVHRLLLTAGSEDDLIDNILDDA